MNHELRKRLDKVRPRLKRVSPLTYRICQGFAGINAILAFYMFFITTSFKNIPLAITQGFLGFTAWGFVFLFLSLLMFYGLTLNKWNTIKAAMRIGLTAKMMWLLALIIQMLTGYPVFIVMVFWLFLVWVQAWTVVHFLPSSPLTYIRELRKNE